MHTKTHDRIFSVTMLGLAAGLMLPLTSAQAQTSVNMCGQTLATAGQYVLAHDLDCSGTNANGVNITASNVVFHLAGHTISSLDCNLNFNISGVFVAGGITNVRVDGGTVSGFNDGVVLSSSKSRVSGMTVVDSCVFGILVQGTGNRVETSVVTGSGVDGIEVGPATGTLITANDTHDNARAGIALSDNAKDNVVSRNISSNNGFAGEGYGIAIFNGSGNRFENNALNHNDFGIRLSGTGRNSATGNTVNASAKVGIWVVRGDSPSTVKHNTVLNSGETDMQDDHVACNGNAWQTNSFRTDIVAGAGDGGPTAGCIR